jgi:hypothetical protein
VLGYTSWSGYCATSPGISEVRGVLRSDPFAAPRLTQCPLAQVYAKPCDPAQPWQCTYRNQLAISPYSAPSVLQCVTATGAVKGDRDGTCRLPPNNHGDACNVNNECASGNCLKELKLCRGVMPGGACVPGNPNQCGTFAGVSYFCQPNPDSIRGGLCAPRVRQGRLCQFASQCARGMYCSRPFPKYPSGTCMAPFSVATGQTTTIGPFMCATANAVLIQRGSTSSTSLYMCADANATAALVGQPCAPPSSSAGGSAAVAPLPPGFECVCAQDGVSRLRPVSRLGLGARAGVWQALHTCMVQSTNIMGEPCEFGSEDMTNVRIGSCVYYACYPYFQQLVNASGSLVYLPPLVQFEPLAQCEVSSVTRYYSDVFSAPCASLSGMESWRCSVLSGVRARAACVPVHTTTHAPPLPLTRSPAGTSLTLAWTNAIISVVFLSLGACYWLHVRAWKRR